MRKKCWKFLFAALAITCALGLCAACGDESSSGGSASGDSTTQEVATGYTVTGAVSNKLTVSNATQTLTFSDVIKVNEGFTFSVHTDPDGMTSAMQTADLKVGDNEFYVRVQGNGYEESNKLTVYRKYAFSVTFDLDGGEGTFESVTVEEGEKLTMPTAEPTRLGFEFDGWDYNFSLPVTKSFTVTALWKQAKVQYTVKILQTDDGETFTENQTMQQQLQDYVGSTVLASAPTIAGYRYNENESVASGVVTHDGMLELTLKYYRLVEVFGEVTVPAGENSITVVVVDKDWVELDRFQEIENGKVHVTAEIPVSNDEYTAFALGYNEKVRFDVNGTEVNFELEPKTYEFGGFVKNELTYQSAGVTNGTTPAATTEEANASTDWHKFTTQTGDILQARGRSHAILFSHFAETEYAVSATVHTFASLYSTGMSASSYSSRTGGFVVATAHDQLHVLITDLGSIWIGLGYMNDTTDTPNGELYLKGNTPAAFAPRNPGESTGSTTASGGYEMTLTRKDDVITLYVGGVKYLTIDKENGAVGYEHLAGVNPTYVTSSTVKNADDFKARLNHILDSNTANAVGVTTFRKTIDATKGYTSAVFSEYSRTADVDGVVAAQAKILKDSTTFVKKITLNGNTLNSTRESGWTVRYAATDEELALAQDSKNMWLYDVEGKDLYCLYETTQTLNTNNTVYFSDMQTGNFEFTFTGALAYRQGFVITDGTNRIAFVGESTGDSDLIRLCQDDNVKSTFLKGQGIKDENTVWRVVVTKNQKVEIYLKNAATENVEKLAITITKTSITTHVGTMNDGSTSYTSGEIFNHLSGLLASNQVTCGFTFTTASVSRPSIVKTFKDISITAQQA